MGAQAEQQDLDGAVLFLGGDASQKIAAHNDQDEVIDIGHRPGNNLGQGPIIFGGLRQRVYDVPLCTDTGDRIYQDGGYLRVAGKVDIDEVIEHSLIGTPKGNTHVFVTSEYLEIPVINRDLAAGDVVAGNQNVLVDFFRMEGRPGGDFVRECHEHVGGDVWRYFGDQPRLIHQTDQRFTHCLVCPLFVSVGNG